jgi:hypothetical protein
LSTALEGNLTIDGKQVRQKNPAPFAEKPHPGEIYDGEDNALQ